MRCMGASGGWLAPYRLVNQVAACGIASGESGDSLWHSACGIAPGESGGSLWHSAWRIRWLPGA